MVKSLHIKSNKNNLIEEECEEYNGDDSYMDSCVVSNSDYYE